ncbi:hypothetical protein QVD17_30317 [Tagetes erecta]|uniref:Subtilisin-like protease fibronectin type-III domain-containing protein n=1 Tax=Tagetes erecta TaxID=13708 RepID=A0AAD8NFX0_TARER|nr:hypothetical protein QVD17_30317 [Tagetes erecta]
MATLLFSQTLKDQQFLDKNSVQKVNLSLNSKEKLSDVEGCDFVKIRPSCCSPVDSGPCLPPYDSNKSFLSPGPRFHSYKPNPQIELLLNNEGNDVARLEESFNLSESLSATEEKEHEKEAELGDGLVVEDKLFDLKEFSSPYPERALAYGSGMIDPIRAKDPGLVYEMSVEELQKVWCSLTNASISRTCRKTLEEHQLNYPSMSFRVQENKPFIITFKRRVTNVGYKNSRYMGLWV